MQTTHVAARLRMSFPSGARAAVGRALLSSHHGAAQKSCLAARTPLRAVCCFRRIRHPFTSGASSWFRGSRWRVFGQSSNSECKVTQTDVTLQSYNYQDGFLQQQDAGHPSAGEARRAVGPNHARWLSSITNSCRMGHKTLMATAKLSPLTEHIHVSRASSDGPSWSHHWKHKKAWMCFVAPLPGLCGISIT